MATTQASTSATPVALHVTVDGDDSAHPTLRISVPASFLDAPSTADHSCEAYLLVKLPPGVFIDPHTFPVHASARRQSAADGPARQGRDAVRSMAMLQGSVPDWDFSRVDLESAIGYTVSTAHERAMIAAGKRTARQLGGKRDPLVCEYTAALLQLRAVSDPQQQEPQAQQIDILAPLHTRYPIPLGRPDAVLDPDAEELADRLSDAAQSVLQPSKAGAYATLLLEQPHAFWTCSGSDLLAVETGVYEKTTAADLLAPMHAHLHLPADLGPPRQLYTLNPPFGTSRQPFRIRVPAGRAELGLPTQAVTFASLLFAALFVTFQVRSAVRACSKR